MVLAVLAVGGCVSTPATVPEPWASALAEYPVPAMAYRPKFSTLCHDLLDLDAQVMPQEEAEYQLLDAVLADAKGRIHWDATETDSAKRRAMALAAFGAMDKLIREHNIIYPPTGQIDTMHEGLMPHHLRAEQVKQALAANPAALAAWMPGHEGQAFYFMDCDILCFLYVSIGQAVGMPVELVACPDHMFVRYDVGDGTHVDWETTQGAQETDDYFIRMFHLTQWNTVDRAFMVDLTQEEILGYYLCCRAIWQENMKPAKYADACADYEEAISLYPECSLARNNLAWLNLSVPGLAQRSPEEVLQMALGALAVVPTDYQIGDTVACAYAEVGDFAKAILFEKDAILAADNDPATTEAVSKELHDRLGIFLAGKTYLEALADGTVKAVTPQERGQR